MSYNRDRSPYCVKRPSVPGVPRELALIQNARVAVALDPRYAELAHRTNRSNVRTRPPL